MAGLPAEGFFSGDPGVKLIAAANAIDHPRRPFEIDLPQIGAEPAAASLERFFALHDDHAGRAASAQRVASFGRPISPNLTPRSAHLTRNPTPFAARLGHPTCTPESVGTSFTRHSLHALKELS